MKNRSCAPYYLVCKAIGRRLFKRKSKRVLALEQARLAEWVSTRDDLERDLVEHTIAEASKNASVAAENGRVQKPWHSGVRDFDEDEKHPYFILSRMWKDYKDHLRTVPTEPLYGPPKWDLTKWSEAERLPFEVENFWGDSDESGSDDLNSENGMSL
jgi:hypothetical protein